MDGQNIDLCRNIDAALLSRQEAAALYLFCPGALAESALHTV